MSMEQDTRDLLKKNLELTKENNRLLKKMRRNALLGGLMKLVWLAVIIGVPVYVYFNFLAPVLDQVLDAAQTVQEVGDKVGGIENQIQEKLQGNPLEDILNIFNRQ